MRYNAGSYALVVQRIEHRPPKSGMQVQFLPRAPFRMTKLWSNFVIRNIAVTFLFFNLLL